MANRRMFSKQVVHSSNFLMMPLSTQALYFHLGMSADDDGYVEHFPVMRMIDSKPDELKILQAKGLVHVFDDKVLVIRDWKENNYIQADRYSASKYLTIFSVSKMDTKCIQDVSKSDTICIQDNSISTLKSTCIQDVYKMDTQDRIGKDRIGKEREKKGEVSLEESNGSSSPSQNIKKYNYSEEHFRIAKEFHEWKMKTHGNLNAVKNAKIEEWADVIRKINNLDGKDIELIDKVLSYALADKFWLNNLISLSSIRDKNSNGISKFEVIESQVFRKGVGDYAIAK